jgi:hypothetical protein
MPTLQTPGISGAEFDTTEPGSFVADCDTALGKEIFNIAVAEVESREGILYADLKMPE